MDEPESVPIEVSPDEILAIMRLDYPKELAATVAKIFKGREATAEALSEALRPPLTAKPSVRKAEGAGGKKR